MMSTQKVIELERAQSANEQPGSFGFSIMGGYGTKFPSCICEVDTGGPADQTKKVRVGDRLLVLNGEELDKMSSKDLVQRIRHAPSPSTFVLLEDETLHQQILAVLRKKERRAAEKAKRDRGASTSSETSVSSVSVDTVPVKTRRISPAQMTEVGVVMEEKKRKRLDKIIEVEPSVNITNGQSGGIVKVRRNKIVGRIEEDDSAFVSTTSRQSPARSSPARSSPHDSQGGVSPLRGSPAPAQDQASGESSASSSPSKSSLKTSPPHVTTSTPIGNHHTSPSLSLDSLSIHSSSSNQGGGGAGGVARHADYTPVADVNGEVKSDSSGVNSVGTPSIVSFEEKTCKVPPAEQLEPSDQQPELVDSGVQIPTWNGHALQCRLDKSRSSLSEDILIGELERDNRADTQHPHSALPTADNTVEEADKKPLEEEEVGRSGSYSKGKRRKGSKKKDDYATAVMVARKLFMLDGYKKSEVAAYLAERSESGQSVAKEYLKFFEMQGQSLEDSLRLFLSAFALTGESQERDRVMIHFSKRYYECNPAAYRSADEVHGLTVALLLLNTDLHSDHGAKKMTVAQFSLNLERIDVKLHKETIKLLYDSIRKNPLEWAKDDDDRSPPTSSKHQRSKSPTDSEDMERVYHVTIPGTFVEVEMSESVPLFKEGYVLKKNIMEAPHKKVTRGKRQWKPYYAYLKGFLLYLEAPRGGDLHLENTSSALTVSHCLAMGAHDYHKKNSVLRVTTSEWQSFLLQASDTMDMQQWITAINKAASTYSAAPLAAPVSSSTVFQRPTYPMAPTKNTIPQQQEAHQAKIKSLTKEMEEHQAYKPKGPKAKHSAIQNWFDKYEFLQFEINRFHIYYASLTCSMPMDFNAPLPSGLVPSPSISTLHSAGSSELSSWKSMTPPHSPPTRNKLGGQRKGGSNSPLVSGKGLEDHKS